MKRIEVQNDNGNYNIDILEDNKYLAGTIIDIKRKQFYLIIPEGYDQSSVDFLVENIIDKISLKKFNKEKNERVGEIKSYSKEVLLRIFAEFGLELSYNDADLDNYSVLSNNNNFVNEVKYINI